MQMSWTYREGPSRVCTSRTVASASCPAGNTRKGRPASYNGSPATQMFSGYISIIYIKHTIVGHWLSTQLEGYLKLSINLASSTT